MAPLEPFSQLEPSDDDEEDWQPTDIEEWVWGLGLWGFRAYGFRGLRGLGSGARSVRAFGLRGEV